MREAIASAADALMGPRLEEAVHGLLKEHFQVGGLQVEYPDGYSVDYGDRQPELRARINDPKVFSRLFVDPTLAVCEGYINGQVDFEDSEDPTNPPDLAILARFLYDNGYEDFDRRYGRYLDWVRMRLPDRELTHYEMGNRYYEIALGESMMYSCAFFDEQPEAMGLQEAQARKNQLIIAKLRPEPGMRFLEVGSGWASTAIAIAQAVEGAEVVGINPSHAQVEYSRERIRSLGLEDRITIIEKGYEEYAAEAAARGEEPFDRVYSIGMMEHVGRGNYGKFLAVLDGLLVPGGVVLNHFIAQQRSKPSSAFLKKWVFQSANLPTVAEYLEAAAHAGFRDPDVESLRPHYALTLGGQDSWRQRVRDHIEELVRLFEAGQIRHPLMHSPEQFRRYNEIYFGMSMGGFAYGQLDLAQVVHTKGIDPTRPMTRAHLQLPNIE